VVDYIVKLFFADLALKVLREVALSSEPVSILIGWDDDAVRGGLGDVEVLHKRCSGGNLFSLRPF
jgi:hypothetical protein